MTVKAFIDTNIYIYALTESQDQKDEVDMDDPAYAQ